MRKQRVIHQAKDIKRRIDSETEGKTKGYADECAARIEMSLETKWDPSTGPPKPLELPERPSLLENGSMAIRYWNLMLDLSEKLTALDEQNAETLDTFRDALKRYGVEATPPRSLGANPAGPAKAGVGKGSGKESSSGRFKEGSGSAAAGKGPGREHSGAKANEGVGNAVAGNGSGRDLSGAKGNGGVWKSNAVAGRESVGGGP
ncbi:hypothetical protein FGG08_005028 [Glutinoglossum americanum]|uniref:Uncharacterized protein n=1 Tax=Glutinoglossum americanum TaxID=1670608 RepID=A0A9P8L3A9_9PEZI|nr:hypothetical protein FGG08_005028 [Glutinoglossum americanum]